jgi:hypothetical protein
MEIAIALRTKSPRTSFRLPLTAALSRTTFRLIKFLRSPIVIPRVFPSLSRWQQKGFVISSALKNVNDLDKVFLDAVKNQVIPIYSALDAEC